jgi:hypothetical protein
VKTYLETAVGGTAASPHLEFFPRSSIRFFIARVCCSVSGDALLNHCTVLESGSRGDTVNGGRINQIFNWISSMDFAPFDKRGYPLVSAPAVYAEWACDYEATVATGLDRPLLEALSSIDFGRRSRPQQTWPAAPAAPAPGYGSKACSSSTASTSHAKCWRSPGRKACIDTWIATMSPGQSSLLQATGFIRSCWRTSILRI